VLGEPRGDLIVETTIDLKLQEVALEAARKAIAEEGEAKKVSQATVVIMDTNGATRALVGGLDYKKSQFNRAVKGLRQPGSTFKTLVYLAAMEFGFSPFDERIDRPINIDGWEPSNYSNKYRGLVTLTEALGRSINTVAAQVGNEVGIESVVALARRLNISSPLHTNPSLALGTGEVTLFELTGAMVPLANGGMGVTPHVISRVYSAEGQVLYERYGEPTDRVLQPENVTAMNYMLTGVTSWGTGGKARLKSHQTAGKTGTTQDYRDAWFIGYTNYYAGGVWVGNDDNSAMKRVTGGSIPAKIWKEVMTAAHEGLKPVALPVDVLPPAPLEREPEVYVSRGPVGGLLGSLFGFGNQRREVVRRRPVVRTVASIRSPFEGPPVATGRRLPSGEEYLDIYGNDSGFAVGEDTRQIDQRYQRNQQTQRPRGLFNWGTAPNRETETRRRRSTTKVFNSRREKEAYERRRREQRQRIN